MKKVVFTSILAVISVLGLAQLNHTWDIAMKGSGIDRIADMEVSTSGNIYITGYFRGTMDFDPSATNFFLTPIGIQDLFLAKYTSNGLLVWAFNIGYASDFQNGTVLTVDGVENVYLSGKFHGKPDFNPSIGTDTLEGTDTGPVGNYGFLAKYDSSGNFLWTKNMGLGTGDNPGFQGILYHNNSIYLSLTAYVSTSAILKRYDNSGNLLFSKTLVGATAIRDIEASVANDIVIVGDFSTSIDMDMGSGTSTLTGYEDIFIGKYDQDGNYYWGQKTGSSLSGDIGRSCATNSAGDIFITGYDQTLMHFSKWNTSGALQFYYAIDVGTGKKGNEIIINQSGEVLICGFYSSGLTCDFDPGSGTYVIPQANSPYSYDAFVVAYDPITATLLWGSGIGGGIDYGTVENDNIHIDFDNSGAIYLSGAFSQPCDFDPSTFTATQIPSASGLYPDCFIAKYFDSAVGLAEYAINKIKIYPNPSFGEFNFTGIIEKTKLEIFDLTGRVIYSETIKSNSVSVNLSNCKKGVFFYKLTDSKNNSQQGKLVVE